MRAATLTSSLAQAPVKHILYSSTRDTLSIDPANTKYAISTLSSSETPGRKYTILALHGSEFCGIMGISFKNIQSHSLGVGKLEVTDETIRQPYSSCLPSARRSVLQGMSPNATGWTGGENLKRKSCENIFIKNFEDWQRLTLLDGEISQGEGHCMSREDVVAAEDMFPRLWNN